MTSVPPVSNKARLYALEELCRRANLRGEALQRWRVEAAPDDGLALRLCDDSRIGKIEFPATQTELCCDLSVRKAWCKEPLPAVRDAVPDFVVPFCSHDSIANQPLFVEIAPGEFRCTEDLLASVALVLSRFEEIGAGRRDEHGRFRSVDSVARREGYLSRPIVDEYGLALEHVIAALDTGFRRSERKVRVKISHDVDLIGIPFGFREPAVQILARRKLSTGLRDLLSGFTPALPGSLRQVIEICEFAGERGLKSTLYWKASARTAFDSGYDITDPRIACVMDWARMRGIEMGLHPGYETFLNPVELAREADRCRKAIGSSTIGGRQHYLRWSPETWLHWEQRGLAYDSTVGYSDCTGFRAGTCWPYHPWLWSQNRRAELLEIPLIVMDQTLISPRYMGLRPDESLAVVRDLLRKCATVGGVFTLLWHNNCLGRPFSAYYPAIFDALAGLENYDWRADAEPAEAASVTLRH